MFTEQRSLEIIFIVHRTISKFESEKNDTLQSGEAQGIDFFLSGLNVSMSLH